MNKDEIRLVAALAAPLKAVKRPFASIAKSAGITEAALLSRITHYKKRKIIRRFGAVVHHRKAGFRANVLVCWRVPANARKRVAARMCNSSHISHCYLRTAHRDWPYNFYTMVHGRSRKECRIIAAALSRQTGIKEYTLLFTEKEFKKSRPLYPLLLSRSSK